MKIPNILFVAHHPISGQWIGGIEVYLANIAKALSEKYKVLILTPKMDSYGFASQIVDSQGGLVREISYQAPYSNWQLTDPEREQAFATILDELDVDLVHFHHLAGHPPSLITIANQKKVPTVFSAHDFFSICHISNLINDEGCYCHPATLTMQQCDQCLSNSYGILPGSQIRRRNAWRDLLASCQALIFNTQSSVDLIASIYPEIAKQSNLYLAPVPILPIARFEKLLLQPTILKVAVMGNFLHHKGADTIVAAMKRLQAESIEFHIFGNVEPIYLQQMESLFEKSVWLHGAYSSGNIPRELQECDVSLHLSICPETYSLTLSEAVFMGLIPVVTNIGALGERVTHEVNGIKIDVGSIEQLCATLRELKAFPDILRKLKNPIFPVPYALMPEHLNQLHEIYDSLITASKKMLCQDTKHSPSSSLSIATDWASFPVNSSLSKCQNNRSMLSCIKDFLLRVLR